MSLSQENFARAIIAAAPTLNTLTYNVMPNLSQFSEVDLQKMAWDLEAIQAAIRSEIDGRPERAEGPVDHA